MRISSIPNVFSRSYLTADSDMQVVINSIAASMLFVLLAVPVKGFSFDVSAFPDSIGPNPVLMRTDEMQTWNPENMFEHVNGEAELLKRYGAVSLVFVSYENESEDYVSVDLLDLGMPINAYGLYRLYSGCDGKELSIEGATVLEDEYTSYAFWGRYFFRINVDIGDHTGNGPALLIADFLKHFTKHLPEQPPLPAALQYLKRNARKPCEVHYHPEHMDYDLQAGPGYSLVGPDGNSYFVAVFDSQNGAEVYVKSLQDRGVSNVLLRENAAIWAKADQAGSAEYMKLIAEGIVEQ